MKTSELLIDIQDTEEIAWAEKCNSYTIITMTNNQQKITDLSLEVLENFLPSNKFMRIHKTFIVNTSEIVEIVQKENSHIAILRNRKSIPISKRKKNILINKLISN